MKIDIAAQLGATTRTVTRREHVGQPTRVVIATRRYGTDREDLWDALTNPERLVRWFSPVTGDLKLGGRYQIEGNARGTITTCEPPCTVGGTWEFGGDVTWVTVRLSAISPDVTELVLEHLAPESPHWEQYGPGAVGIGWELWLLGLALHLPEGAAVTAEGMAWIGTDEGKAFVRDSAQRWCRADIAGGETEAQAQASAARTAAFYTGEAPPEG